MKENPHSLANTKAIEKRLKLINKSHVKQLTEYVNKLKRQKGCNHCIPYFDPFDGGVNAKVLFVQKAPGEGAKRSSFVSRDNDDVSAENMNELSRESGLERTDTILWNIVPWTVNERIYMRTLMEGTNHLKQLLKLLPQLEVVVFQGEEAKRALSKNFDLLPSHIVVLKSILPSWNLGPSGRRDEVLDVFKQVKVLIG